MHFSPNDRHSALMLSATLQAESEGGGYAETITESTAPSHPAGAMSAPAQQLFQDLAGQEPVYRPPTSMHFGVIQNQLADDAKIGILGDWGTGDADAAYLLDQMLTREPSIAAILHLGDIYHSGTPWECKHNFVDPIDAAFQAHNLTRVPVFSIPGNHEYFSGGAGFYGMIDTINATLDSKWQQAASYFCLRTVSGKWQFVGADTGITCIEHPAEPGLRPDELAWHKDKIQGFNGKTIFMTHHQFVSADDAMDKSESGDRKYFNKRLVKDMADLLPGIDLHLWGHDHWFVPYVENLAIPNTTSVLRRGQLMGGSARETATSKRKIKFDAAVRKDASGHPILPTKSNDDLYNHTYAILDLDTAKISHYEVPAWEQGDANPNKTCPPNPLLVMQL